MADKTTAKEIYLWRSEYLIIRDISIFRGGVEMKHCLNFCNLRTFFNLFYIT